MAEAAIAEPEVKQKEDPTAKDEKSKGDGEKPEDNFDLDKWMGEQPDHIKSALEGQAEGLKSALKKEREAAKEASKALERKERESQAASEAKLREDGKYRELLESSEKELGTLRAAEKARVFRDEARQGLKDNNLEEFSDVLMGPRDTVENIVEMGETLTKMIKEQVDTEVAKRLDTGKVNRAGDPAPGKAVGDMTPEEWTQHKKDKGIY